MPLHHSIHSLLLCILSYYGKGICALNSLFQIIMNFVKVAGYLSLLENVNSDS